MLTVALVICYVAFPFAYAYWATRPNVKIFLEVDTDVFPFLAIMGTVLEVIAPIALSVAITIHLMWYLITFFDSKNQKGN